MKIEIVDSQESVRSGTSLKNGKPYQMREQEGFMHLEGQKYPQKIRFLLEDGIAPYAVGMYTLSDQSFKVGRFDSLNIRPILIPEKVGFVEPIVRKPALAA